MEANSFLSLSVLSDSSPVVSLEKGEKRLGTSQVFCVYPFMIQLLSSKNLATQAPNLLTCDLAVLAFPGTLGEV